MAAEASRSLIEPAADWPTRRYQRKPILMITTATATLTVAALMNAAGIGSIKQPGQIRIVRPFAENAAKQMAATMKPMRAATMESARSSNPRTTATQIAIIDPPRHRRVKESRDETLIWGLFSAAPDTTFTCIGCSGGAVRTSAPFVVGNHLNSVSSLVSNLSSRSAALLTESSPVSAQQPCVVEKSVSTETTMRFTASQAARRDFNRSENQIAPT